MKSIARHLNPPEEAEGWLELAGRDDAGYQLQTLRVCLARICAKAQALFDSTVREEVWILDLLNIIKDALVLDLKYESWSETTYETWPYHRSRMYSTPADVSDSTSHPIPQKTLPHVYYDILVAFVWNLYRSCLLHLHEVLLHCLDLLQSYPASLGLCIDPQATRDQSKSTISNLLSDIYDSVPFCIGDIDSAGKLVKSARRIPLAGYLLIWPLYLASVSEEPGSMRDRWIFEKLDYISRVMGIQKAGKIARKVRKNPWDLR
jgi:hypothetical protein